MTRKEAIQFAIEKLANEVDREFDGADLSAWDASDYDQALHVLRELVLEPLD